jgi:hypothetical protein
MPDQVMPPSRIPIDSIRDALFTPMAVRAALQLEVFTSLARGPKTSIELAEALGVKPRRLEALLYQLVLSKFLELQDSRFANTATSAYYLVKGAPNYMGGIHWVWTEIFNGLAHTAESIRTDTAKAKRDFARMSQDELGGFLRGLHGGTVAAGRNLAKQPYFAQARTLIDVGGGSGGLAIGLCTEHLQLHATVVDLPSVVPIARRMVAEAGLSERITVKTIDVVDQPLEGSFDTAAARALFQVLSSEQCEKAARNIGACISSGGTMFVIGFVTDDSRVSPASAVGQNLTFVSTYDDGQAYTESEYHEWLTRAGFDDIRRAPYLAGNSLITARKI